MKPVAFKADAGKMGFRELFRVAGSPGVGLFACTLKLFRLIPVPTDGYGMRSFGDDLTTLDIDELPRAVKRASENYRDKLERIGFEPRFAYSLESYGKQEAFGQIFRHEDGITAASVAYARCVRGEQETVTIVFGLNTMLRDDTYVMTSGGKLLMNKPKAFRAENMPGASPKAVYDRHAKRVEAMSSEARQIKTDADLERLVLNCENEETDFNIARGVYVKMSRAEIALGTRLKQEYDDDNHAGPAKKKRKKDEEEEEEEEENDEEEDEDEDESDDESHY